MVERTVYQLWPLLAPHYAQNPVFSIQATKFLGLGWLIVYASLNQQTTRFPAKIDGTGVVNGPKGLFRS